jgi:hypothetical protein
LEINGLQQKIQPPERPLVGGTDDHKRRGFESLERYQPTLQGFSFLVGSAELLEPR